jgi:hypothetical protein
MMDTSEFSSLGAMSALSSSPKANLLVYEPLASMGSTTTGRSLMHKTSDIADMNGSCPVKKGEGRGPNDLRE